MSGTGILTTSVDAGKDFTGTNKDDLFIADNIGGGKTTSSAADTLDGGKGTDDTFKLYDAAVTAADLPTLKNIENVVIYDNAAVAGVDLIKWDSVETLFLVRDKAASYDLGEKVTTVNLEDSAAAKTLNFDDALTAATLGVNKVTTGTTVITGTDLKTLTINAYGKESTIANITNGAIETLNITGKADLTLTSVAGLGVVKTVDGSKAEGKLVLDLVGAAATLKTVKTGTGDDTVTLDSSAAGNRVVTDGTTIDLGAGNDKLVAGSGTVAASTTTVIDGGAGIDSLDAALVKVGNAGVFANFETLTLTSDIAAASALDMNLLTKSTITTIAIDYAATAAAGATVRNVSTSQSLTVIADATGLATELLFKDAAGTADAYTINFAKDAAAAATIVDADTVTIDGIETVTVNSTGLATTTKNIIDLDADAAKSLVITGDKAIDVTFTTFGTASTVAGDGKGVSTIDASAATGVVTINTTSVGLAENGLTIKGGTAGDFITLNQKATVDAGAGNDTITVAAAGGTLTGGAGNDIFVVGAAAAGAAAIVETDAIRTTITDIAKGDKISGINSGVLLTKANVDGATNLDAALKIALTGTVANNVWFQYGSDTYLVKTDTTANLSATDVIVKLNGLVDLSTSTVSGTDLTIA